MNQQPPSSFSYSPWRHGGWYVDNVRYASGAVGCVSRNFPDRKWRIACDPRPFESQPTFKTRDEAALAEWHLASLQEKVVADLTARIGREPSYEETNRETTRVLMESK